MLDQTSPTPSTGVPGCFHDTVIFAPVKDIKEKKMIRNIYELCDSTSWSLD